MTANHSKISSQANPNDSLVRSVIGEEAERQRWQVIRAKARSQLTGSITIGFLYLMASLVVGSYLVIMIREVARDAAFIRGWEVETIQTDWMEQVVWGYAALAILAVVFFALVLLLIHGKLPGYVARSMELIPAIGSTMRIVALGELCQSIYDGVVDSQTYETSLVSASKQVRDPGLKRWALNAFKLLQSGYSPSVVLASAPIRDQPLQVVSAMIQSELSVEQTVAVWHEAADQCHRLAESRANRAKQFISASTLLISVMLAAFAFLISAVFMGSMITGLASTVYMFSGLF